MAATATVAALVLTALATGTALASTGAAGDRDHWRGQLVSSTRLATLPTRSDVDRRLTADRFDPGTDRYGVRAYRLVYRTVDPLGRPTTASGLLALPINNRTHLRTVSFAHGTEVLRQDAPSTSTDGFLTAPAITFASAGFATVAPDYLGLGLGPGLHPWMDIRSETTASLDLLRAARSFVTGTGRHLERDVLVTGFSQGASAALGLARALDSGADSRFRATALAPISGAYDFQHAEIPALLSGHLHPKLSVAYTAYLLVAYDRLHHIYAQPGDVFQPAYVDTPRLFDGTVPGPQVLAQLPDTVADLLTAQGFEMLRHPRGAFAAALREADSGCDWSPRMPTRLYFSPHDEEAANANTDHCQQALRAHGVDAPTVDLGVNTSYNGLVHEGSEVLGVAATARWFTGEPNR